MAIDKALADALVTAVEEEGQPKAVGHRLKAWVEALAAGGVSEEQRRFYDNVRDALVTGEPADAD